MSPILTKPREYWERLRHSAYWRDIGWLVSGNLAAHSMTLVAMPLLSRVYAPEEYAVLSLFNTGITFTTLISSMRFEYMVQLPREDEEAWRICRLITRTALFTTLALTPLAWLFRFRIAAWTGTSGFAPWVAWTPLGGALLSLGLTGQGWTQRTGGYRRSGMAEAIEKAGRNAFPFLFRIVSHGPGGLILGNSAGLVGKVIYLFRGGSADLFKPVSGAGRVFRTYGKLAFSLVGSNFLMTGTGAIPVLFIARHFNAEVLGQFALANMIIAMPSALLGTAVGNAYYQRAAEQWSRQQPILDLWRSTAKRLLMIGIPVYSLAMVVLPWLVPTLFGGRWRSAGEFSSILCVNALFSFATTPLDRTYLVVGAWWYTISIHSVRLALVGLGAWISLWLGLGAKGYIWLFVLLQIFIYLADYFYQWRFACRSPEANLNS